MQAINIILNLFLMLEVLFLFTCGQRYMKFKIKQNRRSFILERFSYLAVGITAVCNALLTPKPNLAEMLLVASVSILFLLKCFSADRHYKQAKTTHRV